MGVDVDGDGTVGQADLDRVLEHWGTGVDPGLPVPEPGTSVLLGLAGLAMLRRRR